MKSKVTVGLPVYNGDKFISKAIDSILSQTFSDFELIINDNASTDSTSAICKEYLNKDKRISYFRQEKNTERETYVFILNQAKSDYFVYIAADDFWSPNFLEKNINILESNKNVVFTTGKVELFGKIDNQLKSNSNDSLTKKIYKKIRRHYRQHRYQSATGTYQNKISKCLRGATTLLVFSVFRTEILRKVMSIAFIDKHIFDKIIPIIAVRYGDLHVIDEVLSYRYNQDFNKNAITTFLQHDDTFKNMFFVKAPFIKWCWKNLGKKIFLKNLDYFIKLSLANTVFVFISLIRYGIGHKN